MRIRPCGPEHQRARTPPAHPRRKIMHACLIVLSLAAMLLTTPRRTPPCRGERPCPTPRP
ncbi:hypothetical protein SAM23877_3349 [Streptomyces ambofaciens ATCC 23877]|uniref:Uncharacterized protein n=1 Tax=Streptomyces ambofaciens (strain ATCC 23877 / 3486 / DSM 40053 / JCM 4204 / NBRC 12836 / NRRL B-2516) TaxID=278992 RepID=A0A0K2AU07_STRA7|nr:hypothetical protein SAM23877_3349 [Streptomyces ambofaciens ATCC 23877]